MRSTDSITRSLRTASRQITVALGLAAALAVTAAPTFAAPALGHPLPASAVARAAAVVDNALPRGVFRLALEGAGSGSAPATIIIERVGERVEATLLMDERITTLDHVRTDGDRITAEVQTSTGRGRVSLLVDGDAMTGTLTVGRQTYTVKGVRSA